MSRVMPGRASSRRYTRRPDPKRRVGWVDAPRTALEPRRELPLPGASLHAHARGGPVDPRAEPDGPLRYEHVQAVVKARLSMAPRLRQRVLRVPFGLARPLWVDDQGFDLDFHLRRSAVPAPGGRIQLERAVGRVLSRPLDPSKPLWELYVFEGLEHGRTAVLLKLHHALADGIGSMLIASALFDLNADAPTGTAEGSRGSPRLPHARRPRPRGGGGPRPASPAGDGPRRGGPVPGVGRPLPDRGRHPTSGGDGHPRAVPSTWRWGRRADSRRPRPRSRASAT